ncbi:probable cytosolic iron-sulfur protein assembly protein Ciao1 isoform X1 [Tribolium castaneum]|uniref:probable cytosolic iron-sulfur protein assembly protein Ciao1 isoform X1 n=1 Tax=Tribolium castaneum TaxID=7070 RepID=UPI00046C3A5B|nr:PREDICTED: probable cytosolic iron-sulfur protein assembly protein Ciao1 isoform X1 [Tribolium castaneum]|eukprot:XP_971934.2 PREDICTED: probable cytosolic iron-sulfur protein assembly protein Ciao1 isoform X1 [Tribolium castaneum]
MTVRPTQRSKNVIKSPIFSRFVALVSPLSTFAPFWHVVRPPRPLFNHPVVVRDPNPKMSKLEPLQTLCKHTGRVWDVSWHPKGQTFASCGEDKTIRIWSKDSDSKWSNKVILTDGHKRTIREIAWSPCGNYLASASFDTTTCIWDKKSGEFECNATLEGHENEVKSVSWSKSGRFLATCSRDKSVWIWEIAEEDEYDCAAVLSAHTQDVKKVVWHPHDDILASASYDNTVKLFKEDQSDNDWVCFATLQGHESTVWSISWDKTGTRIVSCSDDATLKIWQKGQNTEETWKCVCTMSGYHNRTIYDVSWNHSSDLIATACGDDAIRIFKEEEGGDLEAPTFSQVTCIERAHAQDVNCVAWNPLLSDILVSCSDDGEIKLWKFIPE